MHRPAFTLRDLARECEIQTGHLQLDGRRIGARIHVPAALRQRYPYNASAYAFLQQLRDAIHEWEVIEFPGLPVNPTNHTLAQRAPWEHGYSSNPYMTDICQQPHQDTPPFPTAFWLGESRRFFATWVVSTRGLEDFLELARREPELDIEALHRRLVPSSLADGSGLLVNTDPGLVLLDNSRADGLYHARTCRFDLLPEAAARTGDTPMYAYNEVGLLHYIDVLDSRRGHRDRDPGDLAQVKAFLGVD